MTVRTKHGGRVKGTPNRKTVARRAAAAPDLIASAQAQAREGLGESGSFPPYRLAKVDTLIPYANNARTHTPQSVDALCRQITANGWTAPILVAGKHILAGHRRRLAALKLALDVVPVIDLSHLSENERRAYIIWDNKSALDATWDSELLQVELGDLRDAGFDLSLSGFDGVELAALFNDDEPQPDASEPAEGDLDGKVCCPSCGHEFQTVAKLFRLIASRK